MSTEIQVFTFDAERQPLAPSMVDDLIAAIRHRLKLSPDAMRSDPFRVRWPKAQELMFLRSGLTVQDGNFHNGMKVENDATLPDNELVVENSVAIGTITNLAVLISEETGWQPNR